MATINLTDVLFYRGGSPGASQVVGNDWANNAVISRVARYTIQAPDKGATRISLSFTANQFGDGSYIGLRYYIGTDPNSHANAGASSEYTGEFALDTTYLKFTAAAEFMLMPGKTYYLWVFPAVATYGWYYWGGGASMSAEGAAFLLPVTVGGAWRKIMPHVVRNGKFFLIAPCVVKGGKWHYFGAPN